MPKYEPILLKNMLQPGYTGSLTEYERVGGYQAIRRDPVTGVYAGASESRKDGQAGGY